MSARGEPSILLALVLLLASSRSIESAESNDVTSDGVACDQERQNLCKACGTPDLLDKCCLDDATYVMCLKQVSKRSADPPYWEGELNDFEEQEEDKRAKYFLGKRAKYFLGKRIRNNFLGKRDEYELDSEDQWDALEDKRARSPFLGKRARSPFLGKRARSPFLGKRAKYFLGKRDDELDDLPLSGDEYVDDADKRAKYFLGKRAKYFLGKRSSWEDLLKRAKYFLGKRSEDKRQKYFLGKRSVDSAVRHQENSQ